MYRTVTASVLLLLGASLASPVLAGHDRDNPGPRKPAYHGRPALGEVTWRQRDGDRLRDLATRLETDTDALQKHLDASLDEGRLDGTRREDRINAAAEALENAADRLAKSVADRKQARAAAEGVFDRASELDEIVAGTRLDARTQRDWRRVDADLAALSDFFPRLVDRDVREREQSRTPTDWRRHRERRDQD